MRALPLLVIPVLLWLAAPALAQAVDPASPTPILPPAVANAPDLHIEWEVKNRFRLFKRDEDFQRHVAAQRGDGVLEAERRLERAADGRGWARDQVERLCIDQSGRIPEFCERDGQREVYLAPEDHNVAFVVGGNVAPGSSCAWSFDDGEGKPRETVKPCEEEIRIRLRYGRPTAARVTVTGADGSARAASTDVQVRDLLIAGLGDSIAAGEGNPDRPIQLDDQGFCFRRFLGGAFSEYFRPGRAGYRGSRACDPSVSTVPAAGNFAADWAKLNARWMNAACHRSLYGYQMRAALELAVENRQVSVTFLPLACSGATIDLGFLNPQRIRECPNTGNCPSSSPAQLARLKEALALAQKHQPDRKLDLVLLTIGANDIWFSSLVGNVIVEASTERALFARGDMIISVADSQKLLDNDVPPNFAKLRTALKPLVGGNLSRVVYVTYGHPALQAAGQPCPGGPAGFDVHPAFNADPARLREVANYVSDKFLPRIRALATCEGNACKDSTTERMTFVDAHQNEFAAHGFCARAETDPAFDRECFSEKGESFETDPTQAATDPMKCNFQARDFRPYASRARWIRTANDSYFTAMTYPEGLSSTLQPADLHDATWGATSAVYGGAIHPTAEGHAAMADAALPAMRALLNLPAAPAVRSEPLAPLPAAATPQ
jgi:hypothetical protein